MAHRIVDTTGLTCPMPFFKLLRAIRDCQAGAILEVLSTDPLAPGDFAELCQAKGHQITSSRVDGNVTTTIIEVLAARLGPGG
jgi:tRNA 2-thiouridine synthesizing protein A